MKKLLIAMFALSWHVLVMADEWVSGWQNTEMMNTARAGSAVLAVDGYIYAIGGVDGRRFLSSVEYAKVLDDGALGPWLYTRSLRDERGFLDAVAYKGYVYAVGGGNGPYGKNLLRSIERAKISSNGSLDEWQVLKSKLAMPRRCVKLIISGDIIYAFGGYGGVLLDSVESAQIMADGELGAWTLESENMLMPRYVNAVKKRGDHVYVLGGHRQDEGVGVSEIEYVRLGEDNRFASSWRLGSELAVGRYALSAAYNDEYIYAMGGLDGAIYQDVIERLKVDKLINAEAWQRSDTKLSSPRANFGAVTVNNILYIVGGTNRDGYYQTVEYAGFNKAGDIGYMATPAQLERIRQSAIDKPKIDSAELLPNTGEIEEVIQTAAYSYLKVKGAGGMVWLAAPRDEYEQGMVIAYSRGLTMNRFFSKTLNRRFDIILFVEKVAIQD